MNVISIIIALNSNYACALSYTGIHTDSNDNTIYHIPLMANTNIITGYTSVSEIAFLQVLPGLKHSVGWRS